MDYWVDGGLPCVESHNAESSGGSTGCPGEEASSSSSTHKITSPGEEASSPTSPSGKDEGPDQEASSSKDKKATSHLSIHHLMTHLPKDNNCSACKRAKMYAKQARRKKKSLEDTKDGPRKFGDLATADHLISRSETDLGLQESKVAMVMLDHATNWTRIFPGSAKSAELAKEAINDFKGDNKIKEIYTDNTLEIIKAVKELKLHHETSTPYRSTANSKAERAIRKVLEGTRTVLEQSGFSSRWWPKAAEHFCVGLNTAVDEGETPRIIRGSTEVTLTDNLFPSGPSWTLDHLRSC